MRSVGSFAGSVGYEGEGASERRSGGDRSLRLHTFVPGECENCSFTLLSPFLTVCAGTMDADSDAPINAPHLRLLSVVLRHADVVPAVCKSRVPARLRDLGRGRLPGSV